MLIVPFRCQLLHATSILLGYVGPLQLHDSSTLELTQASLSLLSWQGEKSIFLLHLWSPGLKRSLQGFERFARRPQLDLAASDAENTLY
jgi:hypothetical protein